MFDFVLFDLDGTLTDPVLGITKAYQYALSAYGIHEELDGLAKYIGPPLREVFRLSYGFPESAVEEVVAKFREYFSETGLLENSVYPGIPELLQELQSAGRTLAVATSKAKLYTDRILEHFGLDGYFAFVSGDAMDGSLSRNGKRDIVRMALDALDPERGMRAVLVGDRKHDAAGAADNGIACIGVTWGYGSRDELTGAGCSMIAGSTGELRNMLLGG